MPRERPRLVQEGENLDEPAPVQALRLAGDRRGVVHDARGQDVVFRGVLLEGQAKLHEIVGALDPAGGFPGAIDRGEQKADEVDGFGAADDFAADTIERKFGHLQALRSGLAAAQESANARQEFDEGEGLDQVIVGALFQAFDAIVERAAGAQDEHRRADFAVADFFEDLQAVHVRQHPVENHQIVIGSVNALQRGAAGESGIHRVSGAFKAPAEEVSDTLLVLDD